MIKSRTRMDTSRTPLAIRQELNQTLNERLERRYRDEWIDSQSDLNAVVTLVSNKDPNVTYIKIIQTFHGSLDVSNFLDALKGSEVRTIAFVGINMDQEYARKLARAVTDINSCISCLQLCRIIPTGLEYICPALSLSPSLKELRLTFNHDLCLEGIHLLMRSLGCNNILEIFKLYCVDLKSEGTNLLAGAIRSAKSLTDLRITSCNLTDITSIANAIKESNRLTKVDLSMNRISDSKAMATLWQCKSITYLSLSQNELGADQIVGDALEETRSQFQCLAANTTLKRFYLDMNPLSPDYVELLTSALQQNTTIIRLGLLTLTVTGEAAKRIRYMVSLNAAGRGRIQCDFPDRRLFPHLLSRVSNEPQLIYGLLTQAPHIWM